MSSNHPTSPRRTHRDSSRRRRFSDVESSAYDYRRHQSSERERSATATSPTKKTAGSYIRAVPSAGPYDGREDLMSSAQPYHNGSAISRSDSSALGRHNSSGGLGRKVSLIRPERRRNDDSDPNYYYRKHAQHMNVMPSTTGNDPMLEEGDEQSIGSDEMELKPIRRAAEEEMDRGREPLNRAASRKLQRKVTHREPAVTNEEEKQRRREKEAANARAPSLWNTYCHLVTFWCPNFILRLTGFPQKAQREAWREKMGLISIILLIAAFVGFLTFGFTAVVCPSGGPTRLQVNKVGLGYMIFHGSAYDLTRSHHPLARGIPAGGNVLWDMATPNGGKDGSFLFQNVNGACKDLITLAPNSDVPTDADGNLAWYFPCTVFNQDGSSSADPNKSVGYYLGYACHTSKQARTDFYGLKRTGDVYFTWDDVKNNSRNLMVYNGDVLDLDLLKYFNTTQVSYPARFDEIRTDNAVHGTDVTMAFSANTDKQIAECFQDIIKVGSIDTETIGCIASKVVLYVSLAFILSIVITKFIVALIFQWFLCRKYAASKSAYGKDEKARKDQIEDWTNDIYRPAPKITDPTSVASDKPYANRKSFLPTTSRFTSPYAMEHFTGKNRPQPTTMASQSSTARLMPGAAMYGNSNRSEGTLGPYSDSQHHDSRISLMATEKGTEAPSGFISDAVVPQPPPEWQPFGYPLAHTICLVTAYSEGPEGIRTTLDSVATTEYPNSHKIIFMICDGMIQGKGESMSTPDACLSMMKDHTVLPDEVVPHSYVAVASGSKRHNMAKVYAGFYDYGEDSIIPVEKQQRVPMLVIVKCGTPAEADKPKPGNRGKRDSQIILMSFLQKVMFDERMTELEYEMFNGIFKITGISPEFYEIVLMVDADTKVFPDSLTHMVSAMVKDPEIMGLCGETKIANKSDSWVTMIQVFEYFVSHHLSKSFESAFGAVTCLPGCFCMYRIKTPKGGQNYWVPILANPDIVEHYSENVVDTLHKKNLLLLGEDRYLSTLMLRTFPKRKQVFVPQAVCKTTVPDTFKVLLSQRRRWINSTVHNLMELVLVRDLCGTFCFSMQSVVFIELVGTLVLPAAIAFTIYLITISIVDAVTHHPIPVIPLVLLSLILGLPGVLIVLTAHRVSYVAWMGVYLLSLPVWNFILPTYAYWKFDDFSWGDTRKTAGAQEKGGHGDAEGEFDSSQITMKRWADFEHDRRTKGANQGWAKTASMYDSPDSQSYVFPRPAHQRSPSRSRSRARPSHLGYESSYDY